MKQLLLTSAAALLFALAGCSGIPPEERRSDLQKAFDAEQDYQRRVARGEGEQNPDDEIICEPIKVTGSNIHKVACASRAERRAQREANYAATQGRLSQPSGRSCEELC